MNQIAIMYQDNLKEMVLRTWKDWQDDDIEVYEFISNTNKEEIQKNSRMSVSLIKGIPFIRNISTKNFQSVY